MPLPEEPFETGRLLTPRVDRYGQIPGPQEPLLGPRPADRQATKTFTDPRLCAAVVDRLTFNGTIIETGTDSYRLASRARAEEPSTAG